MDKTVIKVENLHKTFLLPHEKRNSVKSLLLNAFKKKTFETQKVLNGISFEIKEGEFFGIVGRNGSGKSTLLKILAGIYSPNKGSVQIDGRLTPFIELGVGFSPELTGRENVYLNGALLGFTRKEMDAMYDEIVEFAELKKFMDQKLKNYSSGMQVRLAFSIAIQANSDILVLDEVLAVGDEAFQRKCYDYFETLRRNKKTVVLVTHDMSAVERYCSRALLIEEGEISAIGSPRAVARTYSDMLLVPEKNVKTNTNNKKQKNRWGDFSYKLKNVKATAHNQDLYNSPIKIETTIQCNNPKKDDKIYLSFAVKDSLGQVLFGSRKKIPKLSELNSGESCFCTIEFKNILNKGKYFIDISLYSSKSRSYCDFWQDCVVIKSNLEVDHKFSLVTDADILTG